MRKIIFFLLCAVLLICNLYLVCIEGNVDDRSNQLKIIDNQGNMEVFDNDAEYIFAGDYEVISLNPLSSQFVPIGAFEGYYYQNLTANQKRIFKILDKAAIDMTEGMFFLGDATISDTFTAYRALTHDRPEYFWLPQGYMYESTKDGFNMAFSGVGEKKYAFNKQERDRQIKELRDVVTQVQSALKKDMNDYDKELYIHDWLLNRCEYDKEALESSNPNTYTIVGALSMGKAVCEGYARALQLLLKSVGINTMLVNGFYKDDTNLGHMWNMVWIGGAWYNVDPTHNDSDDGIRHLYFNIPDSMIEVTHKPSLDIKQFTDEKILGGEAFNQNLPKADTVTNSYFYKNSTLVSRDKNVREVVSSMIKTAMMEGKKMVEIGFTADTRFTFSQENMKEYVDISYCVSLANNAVPKKMRSENFSYTGVEESRSFSLSW